MILCCRE
jgi:oligopeptidase B